MLFINYLLKNLKKIICSNKKNLLMVAVILITIAIPLTSASFLLTYGNNNQKIKIPDELKVTGNMKLETTSAELLNLNDGYSITIENKSDINSYIINFSTELENVPENEKELAKFFIVEFSASDITKDENNNDGEAFKHILGNAGDNLYIKPSFSNITISPKQKIKLNLKFRKAFKLTDEGILNNPNINNVDINTDDKVINELMTQLQSDKEKVTKLKNDILIINFKLSASNKAEINNINTKE